jgi:hypothetical protein
MAISNNSTGLRPGVCTSTTRPTAPYEGQTIYETDTDLTYVYGGSAWQQVSGGTAVGNSGLVYVTSATIGTAVTSTTVSNCFNSTYDAYRVVITGGVGTTAGNSLAMQLSGLTTTGYYAGIIYTFYSSASVAVATVNNGTSWEFAGSYGTDGIVLACDVINPYLAKPTFLVSSGYANHLSGMTNGKQTSSTSATGFILSTLGGGNMTGGTITVYGYRK